MIGDVRPCFIPRPGCLYCSCDYTGIELVTLSQTCLLYIGYSHMAEVLNSGRDLHSDFAAQVRAISYEQQIEDLRCKKCEAKNFRQLAKVCNFGFPGGMGAARFVTHARNNGAILCELSGAREKCAGRGCPDCLAVSRRLRDTWFARWPEVREYHQLIGRVTTTFPARIPLPTPPGMIPGLIRGGASYCDAANFGFQGLAARGAKLALVAVSEEALYARRGEPLYRVHPVLFLHDEIIAEVPEVTAHEAATRISEVMVETMRLFTPDVRVAAPPALMRRWHKAADPVYVDGRLVPWEPTP